MTAKEFFKSNAFKCLVTLLAVLLFSGVLLTVAYGFLEVSAGEKLQRAVSKIYGGETPVVYGLNDEVIDENNSDPKSLVTESLSVGDATVREAYKVVLGESVEYLVQSVGKGGYSGGTVTCWVSVKVDESSKKITGVGKVSVANNVGQSFIGKITDDMLNKFSQDFEGGNITSFYVDDGYVATGASLSSTAICNAVNGAVKYVDSEIYGHDGTSVYDDYFFTEYIDKDRTTHTEANGEITYNIWTKGYKRAKAFNVVITVKNGTIGTFEIVSNGSTGNWADSMEASVKDGTFFEGKGAEFFTDIFGADMAYAPFTIDNGNVTTGASDGEAANSTYLCMYACAFATKNYEKALGGEVNE